MNNEQEQVDASQQRRAIRVLLSLILSEGETGNDEASVSEEAIDLVVVRRDSLTLNRSRMHRSNIFHSQHSFQPSQRQLELMSSLRRVGTSQNKGESPRPIALARLDKPRRYNAPQA